MKKIYFFLGVFIVFNLAAMAQSTCTNPNGFGFPFQYSGGCYVFVTNTMANADISVYAGNVRVNTTEAKTGNDGFGTVFFDCSATITSVILTKPDGSACEIAGAHLAALASLPVKLTDFRASVSGDNSVALQWTSDFELDSYQYQVERSTDGRNYTTIGQVAAAGNSMAPLTYGFDDNQVGNGVAYYRLKMVDIDGSNKYSTVVYVNNRIGASTEVLSVFPNPFRSVIQLRGITSGDVNSKNIRVYNAMGKEVKYTVSGANAISVDASAPAGVYILRVRNQSYKLMKE